MTNNYPVLQRGQIIVWRNCLVEEISRGEKGYTLNTKPDGWTNNYPTYLNRVPESIAATITPGNRYNLLVERQNKKKKKDGEYDGTWDFMFYYGLIRVATPDDLDRPPEEAFVPEGPSPQQTYTAPAPVSDDRQRFIMLQHASGVMCEALNGWNLLPPETRGTFEDYVETIAVTATWFLENHYLKGGYVMPPEVEEGSTQPTEAPDLIEPTEPTAGAFSI